MCLTGRRKSDFYRFTYSDYGGCRKKEKRQFYGIGKKSGQGYLRKKLAFARIEISFFYCGNFQVVFALMNLQLKNYECFNFVEFSNSSKALKFILSVYVGKIWVCLRFFLYQKIFIAMNVRSWLNLYLFKVNSTRFIIKIVWDKCQNLKRVQYIFKVGKVNVGKLKIIR